MYVIPTLMKNKRIELKMSQNGIAEHIGIHKNTVLYWEIDKSVPHPQMYPMLARLFNTDVRDIERMCEKERLNRRMKRRESNA